MDFPLPVTVWVMEKVIAVGGTGLQTQAEPRFYWQSAAKLGRGLSGRANEVGQVLHIALVKAAVVRQQARAVVGILALAQHRAGKAAAL